MLIECKNGSVELVGTVYKDAEIRAAGKLEVAQATIAESQYKDGDGKYKTRFERITGKFATMKLVRSLRKDDVVLVKGIKTSRNSGDGKVYSEIEAQWVEVWGQHGGTSDAQLPDGFRPAAHDSMTMQEIDGDMPF